MRITVLLVGLLTLTAGCLSIGQDESDTTTDDADDRGPTTTWETAQDSGTVSGAGTPAGSVSQGGGNMASWTVPQDTRIMYLNLTAEGGELSVQYGPNCSTEDTVECGNETSTEDGELREVVEQPTADTWEMYLFLENDAGEVDWQLTATMGVVDS